eukprot:2568244-Pleurochrysis_carterae.AAC.6
MSDPRLQCRLQRIDRHNEDPPPDCGGARISRVHPDRQQASVHRRHECEHACVRGGVPKPRERSRDQCILNTLVQPPYAAPRVELAQRGAAGHAVTILVVHCRAQPHKCKHLNHACDGTADASTQCTLCGPFYNGTKAGLCSLSDGFP